MRRRPAFAMALAGVWLTMMANPYDPALWPDWPLLAVGPAAVGTACNWAYEHGRAAGERDR